MSNETPNHYIPSTKLLLTTTLLAAGLACVSAAQYHFSITLDAAQAGGGARTGSGAGTLTLDDALFTLTFNNIVWSGLSAPATAAHIHGPAGPGVDAGVIYNLMPTYTQSGSTSGSINGTLNLVDGQAGFSLATQLAQLHGGLWYINIHSTAFPGGEIRGQIVPEPAGLALIGVGTATWMTLRRRRSSNLTLAA